jgi:hypothetical protein
VVDRSAVIVRTLLTPAARRLSIGLQPFQIADLADEDVTAVVPAGGQTDRGQSADHAIFRPAQSLEQNTCPAASRRASSCVMKVSLVFFPKSITSCGGLGGDAETGITAGNEILHH